MSEKILDWKGNEVKAGMTIYFVQTRLGILESMRQGIAFPGAGIVWESEQGWVERKNQEIWNLGKPYTVTEDENGILQCGEEITIDDSTFFLRSYFPANSIIAIKGISDKKE